MELTEEEIAMVVKTRLATCNSKKTQAILDKFRDIDIRLNNELIVINAQVHVETDEIIHKAAWKVHDIRLGYVIKYQAAMKELSQEERFGLAQNLSLSLERIRSRDIGDEKRILFDNLNEKYN